MFFHLMKISLLHALPMALAAGLALSASALAQKPIVSDDFESASDHKFRFIANPPDGPGRPNITATIVERDNVKDGHALELTGAFAAEGFEGGNFSQIGAMFFPATFHAEEGRDPAPGKYTLSFDMALVKGPPLKVLQANLESKETNTGGVLSFDVSSAREGDDYISVSKTLDTQAEQFGFEGRPFDPTSAEFEVGFQINSYGYEGGKPHTTEDVVIRIDNVKITYEP